MELEPRGGNSTLVVRSQARIEMFMSYSFVADMLYR